MQPVEIAQVERRRRPMGETVEMTILRYDGRAVLVQMWLEEANGLVKRLQEAIGGRAQE
jgi:hypothetical protein